MNRRKAGRFLAAVLTIGVVGAAVVAVWRARTPGADVNLADAVAVALAGAMLMGAMVSWARRSRAEVAPSDVVGADTDAQPDVESAAQVLAGLVERQWRAEASHRLLDDPEPIPVHWRLIADKTVMSQPRLITTDAELTMTGCSDDIRALADAFHGLARRRLVITGGAGMGKTTLAIQLLLHLLSTRAAGQAAAEGKVVPVPVLLPVSGWDTEAHPRLHEWLAVRLAQDYPALAAPQLGPGAAAALADGGHILAVLDGLDEIPGPARAEVIAALNASLTDRDQLILTSRRAEFTTAVHEVGRPLTAAAVIVPTPITAQAAADYLTACLPASPPDAWTQTLVALRSRTVPGLTRLAATPLGLWLIRSIYLAPKADPTPLTGPLGGDANALRAHLLDRLIPALIQARPPSTDPTDHFGPRHRLDPDTTRRYLTYLAHAFPPDTTRDITWWHITRTTPQLQSTATLVFGLVFGLAYLLASKVMLDLVFGLVFHVMVALLAGVMNGLALGFMVVGPWANDTPGYINLRLRGRTFLLLRTIKGNLAAGLGAGLWSGLLLGLLELLGLGLGLGFGFVLGAALATVIGATLACGLIDWAEQPTLTSTSTPRSSWQSDRAVALLRIMALALAFGLIFGLKPELVFGLVLALMLGLTLGNHHAWLACTIAVARLALTRQLPWRVMNFLDDAHRLGLLRAVGPVYQFRHAALHDHLATAKRPARAS